MPLRTGCHGDGTQGCARVSVVRGEADRERGSTGRLGNDAHGKFNERHELDALGWCDVADVAHDRECERAVLEVVVRRAPEGASGAHRGGVSEDQRSGSLEPAGVDHLVGRVPTVFGRLEGRRVRADAHAHGDLLQVDRFGSLGREVQVAEVHGLCSCLNFDTRSVGAVSPGEGRRLAADAEQFLIDRPRTREREVELVLGGRVDWRAHDVVNEEHLGLVRELEQVLLPLISVDLLRHAGKDRSCRTACIDHEERGVRLDRDDRAWPGRDVLSDFQVLQEIGAGTGHAGAGDARIFSTPAFETLERGYVVRLVSQDVVHVDGIVHVDLDPHSVGQGLDFRNRSGGAEAGWGRPRVRREVQVAPLFFLRGAIVVVRRGRIVVVSVGPVGNFDGQVDVHVRRVDGDVRRAAGGQDGDERQDQGEGQGSGAVHGELSSVELCRPYGRHWVRFLPRTSRSVLKWIKRFW